MPEGCLPGSATGFDSPDQPPNPQGRRPPSHGREAGAVAAT